MVFLVHSYSSATSGNEGRILENVLKDHNEREVEFYFYAWLVFNVRNIVLIIAVTRVPVVLRCSFTTPETRTCG